MVAISNARFFSLEKPPIMENPSNKMGHLMIGLDKIIRLILGSTTN
jgi:hypothetical protein